MPPHAGNEKAPVKSGELVRLDYELWAEGGGRSDLIDTTRENVAQEAKLESTEGLTFGPRPHLIGGDYFPGGIEGALEGLVPGEEVAKEFAPADAFGERDPKLIELFTMHEIARLPEMRRDDAQLDVGTVLTIKGRRGRVVSLTAARVRVDFNAPFAGRKIRGSFKVAERIHDPAEQVRALVELNYGRGSEFHVEVHDQTITIRVPDRTKFDFAWMAAKPRVIDRIRTQLAPHTVRIVEEYVTPASKEPAAEKATDTDKSTGDQSSPSAESPAPKAHAHTHAAKSAGATKPKSES